MKVLGRCALEKIDINHLVIFESNTAEIIKGCISYYNRAQNSIPISEVHNYNIHSFHVPIPKTNTHREEDEK